MNESKRQQIIDLINEYIYTNGKQRITAVQLNEILTLIANSFELTGQGTGGGINDVLNTDRTVENNQSIVNLHGGQLELSGTLPVTDKISVPYIGFTTIREGNEEGESSSTGTVLSNELNTYIGHASGFNPFENSILNDPYGQNGPQIKGQYTPTHVFSLYISNNTDLGDNPGEDVMERGLYSGLLQEHIRNSIQIKEDEINIEAINDIINSATGTNTEFGNRIRVLPRSIHQETTYDKQITSSEVLTTEIKYFDFQNETALEINKAGLRFKPGRGLAYETDYSGSGRETVGVVALEGGQAFVGTKAIHDKSQVVLTVQNGGEFSGNIRVLEKMPGEGFIIVSTETKDNCQVFWQLVDVF